MALLMDPATGSEGQYAFEGPDDLLTRMGASRAIHHFFDHLDETEFPNRRLSYELSSAHRTREHGVVTGMGKLVFDEGAELPFVVMISAR